MADSHCHISDIPFDIIDAVRNYGTVSECCKVMVKGLQGSVGESLFRSFEVTGQFFFLGINTDADRLQGLAGGGYILKQIVPVLDIPHRDILAEGTLLKF